MRAPKQKNQKSNTKIINETLFQCLSVHKKEITKGSINTKKTDCQE